MLCDFRYRAPELVMEDVQYTHQVDVWGCGCILAEFLSTTRGILFPGEDRIKQLGVILNVIGMLYCYIYHLGIYSVSLSAEQYLFI